MIILLTGDGKGKTTSALGHAFRALGNGARVIMFQFIKGPWLSGEDILISKIKNPPDAKALGGRPRRTSLRGRQKSKIDNLFNFEIIKGGKGFVGILGDKLPFSEHKKAAQDTLKQTIKAGRSGEYNLIILDEVNVAVDLKLLRAKQILNLIKQSQNTDFILTGRNAPKQFYKIADIVSEIKNIKHRFDQGKLAKRGLEY